MAKIVLTDVSAVINGIDLSASIREVTLDVQRGDVDDTTMGNTGKRHLGGLRDEKVTIKWAQDFAASLVDATMWPIYTGGTPVGATIKPTSATVTNVTYAASLFLQSYQPLAGQVGVLAEAQTSFMVDGVITRATI